MVKRKKRYQTQADGWCVKCAESIDRLKFREYEFINFEKSFENIDFFFKTLFSEYLFGRSFEENKLPGLVL